MNRVIEVNPLLWIVLWLIFAVFVFYPYNRGEVETLDGELKKLELYPQAKQIGYGSFYDPLAAEVDVTYAIPLAENLDNIEQYNESQLKINGWIEHADLGDWVEYCKGSRLVRYWKPKSNNHIVTVAIESGPQKAGLNGCEAANGSGFVSSWSMVFGIGFSLATLLYGCFLLRVTSTNLDYQIMRGDMMFRHKSIAGARLSAIGWLIASVAFLAFYISRLFGYF